MSKKINPTSIGLFIVIGVALLVIGLLLFSSSKLFSRTQDEIVYFDKSLNGLEEGAPVKYRGVTIGSVKRVMINFNQSPNDYALPVIIEVQRKLVWERFGDESLLAFTPESMERRVRNGLRATLQTESLVTGVLFVGLDFHPKAPPPVFHQLKKAAAVAWGASGRSCAGCAAGLSGGTGADCCAAAAPARATVRAEKRSACVGFIPLLRLNHAAGGLPEPTREDGTYRQDAFPDSTWLPDGGRPFSLAGKE